MEIGFEICKWITIVLTIITAPITLWTVVTTLMAQTKRAQKAGRKATPFCHTDLCTQ
nr:hypothetical protein [uncultured Christensenella sp.]